MTDTPDLTARYLDQPLIARALIVGAIKAAPLPNETRELAEEIADALAELFTTATVNRWCGRPGCFSGTCKPTHYRVGLETGPLPIPMTEGDPR